MIVLAPMELAVLSVFLAEPELHDHEIAAFFGIGKTTAKRHMRRLRRKFGAFNRVHLAAICHRGTP